VREQFEPVHRKTQVGEERPRGVIGRLGFHPALQAVKAFTQGAMFIGFAQPDHEPPHPVRLAPGFLNQPQRGGEFGPPGLHFLEHSALKNAALPRPVRVEPAGAVCAQGAAWLGKSGNGIPAAREGDRQPQRLQVFGIIALLELHAVEERAVATQAAGKAKLFAGSHAAASGIRGPERKPAFKKRKPQSRITTRHTDCTKRMA